MHFVNTQDFIMYKIPNKKPQLSLKQPIQIQPIKN